MRTAPTHTCPVCQCRQTEEAEPVTRTTARGRKIVVALRRRCTDCGYTDRTAMFRGATSLTYREWPDGSGRGPFPEEVED